MSVVGVSCQPSPCVPRDLGRGSEIRIAGPFASAFFAWSTDGRTLYVPGLWRMTNRLYAIDVAADETRPITQDGRAFWSFSLSADRKMMAFLASDSASAGDVFVSPVSGSAPRRLTTINPELRSGGQSTAAVLEQLIGGSPSTRPDEYAHISPANFADRLRTPTFVSECAGCGFPAQGEILASALRRNNTPVETVAYGITPGDIAWGPKILATLLRRSLEWFQRWIPTSDVTMPQSRSP